MRTPRAVEQSMRATERAGSPLSRKLSTAAGAPAPPAGMQPLRTNPMATSGHIRKSRASENDSFRIFNRGGIGWHIYFYWPPTERCKTVRIIHVYIKEIPQKEKKEKFYIKILPTQLITAVNLNFSGVQLRTSIK